MPGEEKGEKGKWRGRREKENLDRGGSLSLGIGIGRRGKSEIGNENEN